MKKLFFTLCLTFILALVLAGCGSEQDNTGAVDEPGFEQEAPEAVEEAEVEESTFPETTTEEDAVTEEEPAVEPSTSEMAEEDTTDTTMEEPEAAVEEAEGTMEEPAEAAVDDTATETEPVESAQTDEMTDETEVIPPTGTVNLNRISNLLDFEVWNRNNEQIGEVNAIVIDKDKAQIAYVILGTGGFLGLGESEIPVPWQAIEVHGASAMATDLDSDEAMIEENAASDETMTDDGVESDAVMTDDAVETPQNVFIVDLTAEELDQAPEFDLTPFYEQPELTDGEVAVEATSREELEAQIQSFWQDDLSQTETATEADETMEQDGEAMVQTGAKQYILAEDLLDASVEDSGAGVSEEPAGADAAQEDLAETEDSMVQTIGNVEEITVDATTGEVSYVLVSLNAVSSIVIDEAPAGGVEAPTDGRVDETTADESQTVFTDTTQLATIELVPIPFTAVDWNGEEEVLIYTGSESLEEAPALSFEAIESGGFDWTSEADSYWGLEGSETESQ